MNRLILGTAQFGSSYGIKQDGQPTEKEIEKIAKVASDNGIDTVFNSPSYGCDELVQKYFSNFTEIRKTDEQSQPQKFKKGKHWGVSVYNLMDLNRVFRHQVGMICLPINVFDRRFLPWLATFKNMKFEIYVRSVFLQGLLLMDNPPIAQVQIGNFHQACEAIGKKPFEVALGWVLGLPIDYVIIGVNSAKQLRELVKVEPLYWNQKFGTNDLNIIDPRRWNLNERIGNNPSENVQQSASR